MSTNELKFNIKVIERKISFVLFNGSNIASAFWVTCSGYSKYY